ncbi:TetR/AcrR family transcriptional regulator [Hyphobacterium sp. HN65]|uniref:TetR/AcrR family transcriptional regulator n=1 Tax=Hyphobacterium lacteum TaxID=3116575 RepID=A0ABU7LVA7_9PROT|nr:TetR/AcrR family transcriptional regulator [Hyphobacterium sp. HN65]MEE2527264.1 TetR/AcrR family transcriptional regulator [Hyphobacterium sp. HN65]
MNADVAIDSLTPAERRRLKVRDAIIEAAETLFTKEGEQGISMRRLAEAIDYSPAAIYKYFDSKEALFSEMRELFFERLIGRMNEAAEGGGDEHVLCARCGRVYIETALEEPNHYLMAFSFWKKDETPDENSFAFHAEEQLCGMIRSGIEKGLFRDMDPMVASKSVWASVHGIATLMASIEDFPQGMPGSEHVTRDAVIDFHTDMIIRGLSA